MKYTVTDLEEIEYLSCCLLGLFFNDCVYSRREKLIKTTIDCIISRTFVNNELRKWACFLCMNLKNLKDADEKIKEQDLINIYNKTDKKMENALYSILETYLVSSSEDIGIETEFELEEKIQDIEEQINIYLEKAFT